MGENAALSTGYVQQPGPRAQRLRFVHHNATAVYTPTAGRLRYAIHAYSHRGLRSIMNYGYVFRLAATAAMRPRLALTLVRIAWRMRARDWYRRPPFLPLPTARYVAWRLHTAFGDVDHSPDAAELERYATWVRWMGRMRSRGRTL